MCQNKTAQGRSLRSQKNTCLGGVVGWGAHRGVVVFMVCSIHLCSWNLEPGMTSQCAWAALLLLPDTCVWKLLFACTGTKTRAGITQDSCRGKLGSLETVKGANKWHGGWQPNNKLFYVYFISFVLRLTLEITDWFTLIIS